MKTLINLIGEQPIPNLLPPLFLKSENNLLLYSDTTEAVAKRVGKMLQNSEFKKIEPYNFSQAVKDIERIAHDRSDLIFNITGGTKVMSLAAFQVANKIRATSVYLQSEGKINILYSNDPPNGKISLDHEIEIPELLNIDLYLRAHLPDYEVTGFSIDANTGRLSSGGEFEKAIDDVVDKNKFEVLVGIRPKGVGNQIEIDFVVRLKGTNNVGIAEIKLGDKNEEGPKKGLDQLVMAAERDYLGTYTTRFLITQSRLSNRIKELARTHHINIIDGLFYDFTKKVLNSEAQQFLNNRLFEKLT